MEETTTKKGSCCGCSGCNIVICVLSITALLLLFALMGVTVLHTHPMLLPKPEVCSSNECRRLSATILSNMDVTADPCKDFYQYTCGGYKANNPIQLRERGMMQKMQTRMYARLHEAFYYYKDYNHSDIVDYPWKVEAAKMYQACYDNIRSLTDRIISKNGETLFMNEKSETEQVRALFNNSKEFPAFSYLNRRASRRWTRDDPPERALAQFIRHNMAVGVDLWERYVMRNLDDDKSRMCVTIQEPAWKFFEDVDNAKYEKGVTQIFKRYLDINLPISTRNQMLILHKNVWKIMHDTLDGIANPTDLIKNNTFIYNAKQMEEIFQNRRLGSTWNVFFHTLFGKEPADLLRKTENSMCIVFPNAVRQLLELFANQQRDTVIAYWTFNAILRVSPYIPSLARGDFKENIDRRSVLRLSYQPLFVGNIKPAATCINLIHSLMPMIPVRVFYDRYMGNEAKMEIDQMVADVKEGFKTLILESKYSGNAKLQMIKKVDDMGTSLTLPSWYNDDKLLSEIFSDMKIEPNFFLGNLLHLLKYSRKVAIKSVIYTEKKIVSDQLSQMNLLVVNARFRMEENTVILPMGIVQSPFYQNGAPYPINYGGIGIVIGHEIGHAFDTQGHKVNKIMSDELKYSAGYYYQVIDSIYTGSKHGLWGKDSDDEKRFQSQFQCIVDYHDKVEVTDGVFLSGNYTVKNDLPDYVGVRAAYKAFQKKLTELDTKPKRMIGMEDFTPEQVYFLGVAQPFCENPPKEYYKKYQGMQGYSPNKIRLLGPLQSSFEFAKAYNCPVGTEMNPKKKCVLW